ncbi:MAG: Holliday junction branch migration protein RuvA, partial [Actinomyces graevenitzii]|nr:Holliday junction branch migration protein RuvA [Actinomyces graevenitzii]
MISSLRGEVTAVTLSSAVIETGGVGLVFNATPNTLSTLQVGGQAKV